MFMQSHMMNDAERNVLLHKELWNSRVLLLRIQTEHRQVAFAFSSLTNMRDLIPSLPNTTLLESLPILETFVSSGARGIG